MNVRVIIKKKKVQMNMDTGSTVSAMIYEHWLNAHLVQLQKYRRYIKCAQRSSEKRLHPGVTPFHDTVKGATPVQQGLEASVRDVRGGGIWWPLVPNTQD